MIIQYNVLASNAGRMLGLNKKLKGKSVQKTASGYKINTAADDAAALSISEKTRAMIRGLDQASENIEDGISLCQVADGALSEVHDMLHRLTELSVQSANGTNSDSDRAAIQDEVGGILKEIDRIGDTTKFNDIYVFQGRRKEVDVIDDDYLIRQVPFPDWSFAYKLGDGPFGSGSQISDPGYLRLRAVVNNPDSAMNGRDYNLVYGNGNTSTSSIWLQTSDGNEKVIELNNTGTSLSDGGSDHFTYVPGSYEHPTDTSWSRKFNYSDGNGIDITLTQTVEIDSSRSTDHELYYKMTYDMDSTGTKGFSGYFQFHCDTAYNNRDRVEGYYMNGSRLTASSVWRDGSMISIFGSDASDYKYGLMNPDTGEWHESFSIVNKDEALAFSEKIIFFDHNSSFRGASALSVGNYFRIKNWDYYDDYDVHSDTRLSSNLGVSTIGEDLGFSLFTRFNHTVIRHWSSMSFYYGIADTGIDPNLFPNDDVSHGDPKKKPVYDDNDLWIQSGNETMSGFSLKIGAMNTEILGMKDMDVSTEEGATRAIDTIGGALSKISEQRSRIGAQQNRLEHSFANNKNTQENLEASESRLRDTDMAKEMVALAKQNILEQAGQSVLSQAMQTHQGVLQLLQ